MAPRARATAKTTQLEEVATPLKSGAAKRAKTSKVLSQSTTPIIEADTPTPDKSDGNRKRSQTETVQTDDAASATQSAKRGKNSQLKDPKQRTLSFSAAAKPPQLPEPEKSCAEEQHGTEAEEEHVVIKHSETPSTEMCSQELCLGGCTFSCVCTRDSEVADKWADMVIQDVSGADSQVATVIGLDCEWAAPWHRAAGVPDRLATIQVFHHGSHGKRALVFCVAGLEGKLPPLFQQMLCDPRIAKLGVNVSGDATRIVRDFSCPVNGLFDLCGLNKLNGKKVRKSVSLEDIVKQHCPEDMHIAKADAVLSKGVRTSNWEAWPLSAEQIEYAAKDAALGVQAFIHRFGISDGAKLSQDALKALVNLEEAAVPDATKQEALAVATIEKAGEDPGNKPNFFIAMRNSALKAPNIGKKEHPQGKVDALKKVNVVVSGILDSFERGDFEKYVKEHGGSVSKGITGKVTHLVNDHGEAGPSKIAKCKELGIPMVSEDVILELVKMSKA